VQKIIDVRLKNTSQLAGYAKQDDLEYILELVGIKYEHRPELAPTDKMLKDFKKKNISWDEYEKQFGRLLLERDPLDLIDFNQEPDTICLLCSEDEPKHCHRRLLAEFFASQMPEITVEHL